MKVSLIAMTKELNQAKVRTPEETIVKIARVSSGKTGEDLYKTPEKLLKYCIDHKHWSVFETVNLVFEVETSLAIATQLLRHKSMCFQQFSQRYQDVTKIGDEMFEPVQLRKAGATNRQSSLEEFDPQITVFGEEGYDYTLASKLIDLHLKQSEALYKTLIASKVAPECARMILPQTTKTKLYVNGNVRSIIHLLMIRDDEHAQLEIRQVACEIKRIFIEHFPHTATALEWHV